MPLFEPFAKMAQYGYYHGYSLFDKEQLEPAYSFGFGLNYSDFSYKELNIIDTDISVKLLRGFQKVKFEIPVEELAWYNPETGLWEIEEMEYELYLGSSSAEADLSSSTFNYTNSVALPGSQE